MRRIIMACPAQSCSFTLCNMNGTSLENKIIEHKMCVLFPLQCLLTSHSKKNSAIYQKYALVFMCEVPVILVRF